MFLRLLFAFIIIGCLPADAARRSVSQGFVSGGVTYVGPGDVGIANANADGFWGLRAFTAAIAAAGTQKLVNIVRASDSHACDVLVATTGGMGNTASCGTGGDNGQSASSFCNATTCKVATWYDQSGANECTSAPCNLTQATSANQPQLVFSCLGALPCIQFVGSSSQWLQSGACNTSCAASPTNLAMYTAMRNGAFTSDGAVFDGGAGNIFSVQFNNAANQTTVYNGGANTPGSTVADSAWHNIVGGGGYSTFGTTSSTAVTGTCVSMADGVVGQTLASCGTAAFAGPITVGATNSASKSNYLTADIMEIWFVGNVSGAGNGGNALIALCHNEFLYYGTSTSC